MFPELEKVFESIRAVRDCPAVRRLCLDCWGVASAAGEAEGLKSAAVVLSGVRAYREYERRIAGLSLSRNLTTQRDR